MIGNRVKYTITTQQTQRISLEILHTIASICEENGFRYYLFGSIPKPVDMTPCGTEI